MDEKQASPIILAAIILVAPLLLYIAGYFGLSNPGTQTSFRGPVRLARFFPTQALAEIYHPAARVESAVRSREVIATYHTQ